MYAYGELIVIFIGIIENTHFERMLLHFGVVYETNNVCLISLNSDVGLLLGDSTHYMC